MRYFLFGTFRDPREKINEKLFLWSFKHPPSLSCSVSLYYHFLLKYIYNLNFFFFKS